MYHKYHNMKYIDCSRLLGSYLLSYIGNFMINILVFLVILPCRYLRLFKAVWSIADGYIILLIWIVLSDNQVVSLPYNLDIILIIMRIYLFLIL